MERRNEFERAKNLEGSVEEKEIGLFDDAGVSRDVTDQIQENLKAKNLLGEGQAAKVFDIHLQQAGIDLCAKAFKTELSRLDPVEQARRRSDIRIFKAMSALKFE